MWFLSDLNVFNTLERPLTFIFARVLAPIANGIWTSVVNFTGKGG